MPWASLIFNFSTSTLQVDVSFVFHDILWNISLICYILAVDETQLTKDILASLLLWPRPRLWFYTIFRRSWQSGTILLYGHNSAFSRGPTSNPSSLGVHLFFLSPGNIWLENASDVIDIFPSQFLTLVIWPTSKPFKWQFLKCPNFPTRL